MINKKKFFYRVIVIMLILLNLFGTFKVQARDPDAMNQGREEQQSESLDDPTLNPNAWKPNVTEEPVLFEKAGLLLGTINVIGVVCSIIVLIIIGIRYMLGSIEEKAEYKKTIWTYALGMFFLVAATTIPNLIYSIVDGLF